MLFAISICEVITCYYHCIKMLFVITITQNNYLVLLVLLHRSVISYFYRTKLQTIDN